MTVRLGDEAAGPATRLRRSALRSASWVPAIAVGATLVTACSVLPGDDSVDAETVLAAVSTQPRIELLDTSVSDYGFAVGADVEDGTVAVAIVEPEYSDWEQASSYIEVVDLDGSEAEGPALAVPATGRVYFASTDDDGTWMFGDVRDEDPLVIRGDPESGWSTMPEIEAILDDPENGDLLVAVGIVGGEGGGIVFRADSDNWYRVFQNDGAWEGTPLPFDGPEVDSIDAFATMSTSAGDFVLGSSDDQGALFEVSAGGALRLRSTTDQAQALYWGIELEEGVLLAAGGVEVGEDGFEFENRLFVSRDSGTTWTKIDSTLAPTDEIYSIHVTDQAVHMFGSHDDQPAKFEFPIPD